MRRLQTRDVFGSRVDKPINAICYKLTNGNADSVTDVESFTQQVVRECRNYEDLDDLSASYIEEEVQLWLAIAGTKICA